MAKFEKHGISCTWYYRSIHLLRLLYNVFFQDIGPKLQYNLLCDGLPEDKQLREQLQMNKLVGTVN